MEQFFQRLFSFIEFGESFIWSYMGIPAILLLGIYFTVRFKFPQMQSMLSAYSFFKDLFQTKGSDAEGIHPLKTFFSALGGIIGIGNIVVVCISVEIGGPGAIFWVWMTGLMGMILKYAEIYLGLRYRERNSDGSYSGGPLYFLKQVKGGKVLSYLFAFFMCIYGIEVLMFNVIVESFEADLLIPRPAGIALLLGAIFFAVKGGGKRVANIATVVVPVFIVVYVALGGYIIFSHSDLIWPTIKLIFSSAFTGHAAVGGFLGSTLLVTIGQGIQRGCYTGDICVGYSSMIYSEARVKDPKEVARLGIWAIFMDTFVVCTISVFIVLLSGVWNDGTTASFMVKKALSQHFPSVNVFMAALLFLTGYSTIIAFFFVGMKSAAWLSPRYGQKIYLVYGVLAQIFFSFVDTTQAASLMGFSGACLMLINVYAITTLRKEIKF